MPKRGVGIEDLRGFVFVSDPQVSPDGGKVAFVHTTVDYDGNDYVKHIWMAGVETGEATQFTYGAGKDSNPRWSPDGSRLLFLSSNREPDKKNQLLVMGAGGGEAVPVADMENGVMNPEWSPDSKRILFTSRVWEPEKPETDVVVVKRIYYRLNAVGMFSGKRVHLFTVRPGQKPKQITRGEYDVGAASWSPNGKKIAFVTNPSEDADLTYVRDIYVTPSGGGDWRKVTGGRHGVGSLSWSPDGDVIAYLGHDFHARGATNTDIWLAPSEGGPSENLTLSFDRSIGRGVGSDLRVSSPDSSPVWSPDGGHLYFITGGIPSTNLYRVEVGTGTVERLTEGFNLDGFSFSHDMGVLAYCAMDSTHPCELYVKDERGARRVTSFNDKLLERLDLVKPEHYKWVNELGDPVDAWIMKPVGFDPQKRYPAVLQIHGGPLSIYGDGVFHEFQVMASSGYAVIYTNPRGSGGYGEEYAATLNGRYGTVDYRDILDFTKDAVQRFGFIDPSRLGVTGGSYGGYLTNWIVTQTDTFKAAVSCRSTCNRLSHHGYSDLGYQHGESGNMGYPWRDEEKLMSQSPIRYAANIKTPTLLIHSENDLRCPMQQAEEFFAAMKELGVDTELVRFPEENHELSRSGKPKHREERLRHIMRWFDKYLK